MDFVGMILAKKTASKSGTSGTGLTEVTLNTVIRVSTTGMASAQLSADEIAVLMRRDPIKINFKICIDDDSSTADVSGVTTVMYAPEDGHIEHDLMVNAVLIMIQIDGEHGTAFTSILPIS